MPPIEMPMNGVRAFFAALLTVSYVEKRDIGSAVGSNLLHVYTYSTRSQINVDIATFRNMHSALFLISCTRLWLKVMALWINVFLRRMNWQCPNYAVIKFMRSLNFYLFTVRENIAVWNLRYRLTSDCLGLVPTLLYTIPGTNRRFLEHLLLRMWLIYSLLTTYMIQCALILYVVEQCYKTVGIGILAARTALHKPKTMQSDNTWTMNS